MSKFEAWSTVMVTGMESRAEADEVNRVIASVIAGAPELDRYRRQLSVDCLTNSYDVDPEGSA